MVGPRRVEEEFESDRHMLKDRENRLMGISLATSGKKNSIQNGNNSKGLRLIE